MVTFVLSYNFLLEKTMDVQKDFISQRTMLHALYEAFDGDANVIYDLFARAHAEGIFRIESLPQRARPRRLAQLCLGAGHFEGWIKKPLEKHRVPEKVRRWIVARQAELYFNAAERLIKVLEGAAVDKKIIDRICSSATTVEKQFVRNMNEIVTAECADYNKAVRDELKRLKQSPDARRTEVQK